MLNLLSLIREKKKGEALIGAQRSIDRVWKREIKTPSVTEQVKAKDREKKGVHPLNNPEHWTERQKKKIKQS